MKAISIYQRRGFLYISPSMYTVHGVGVDGGPCIKLPITSTSATELGEAALQSLDRSGAVVPHPEDWDKRLPGPVLTIAGVKNWTTFSRGATCLEITLLKDELLLTPTRKQGRLNYMPVDDDDHLHLPARPTAEALGEAIERALARCR